MFICKLFYNFFTEILFILKWILTGRLFKMIKRFIPLLIWIFVIAINVNTVFADNSNIVYGDADNNGTIQRTTLLMYYRKFLIPLIRQR